MVLDFLRDRRFSRGIEVPSDQTGIDEFERIVKSKLLLFEETRLVGQGARPLLRSCR
jgi:hypothetical protein